MSGDAGTRWERLVAKLLGKDRRGTKPPPVRSAREEARGLGGRNRPGATKPRRSQVKARNRRRNKAARRSRAANRRRS